jgi:8-oxo-dGTP diphosphatase
VERDGNGWVECSQGHRHWGRHGAAGLLLHTVDDAGELRLLMQHRAEWCHHGGTWGLPGGARDSHETVAQAALREAHEETALDITQVRVRHTFVDDHGGWSYTTVYADSVVPLQTTPNDESAALEWVTVETVGRLPLHPGFGSTWPVVRLRPLHLVIDSANVVGAVPDGWWRDRTAATERFASRLTSLLATTVDDGCPGVIASIRLVVEGAARDARLPSTVEPVRTLGSGDDALVEVATHLDQAGLAAVAVTSDRALRSRIEDATAHRVGIHGAGWLRGLLDDAPGR